MKHAGIIILIVFITGIGCRSHKTSVKSGQSETREQITETRTGHEVRKGNSGTKTSTEVQQQEVEYTVITELDSSGVIRRVQETWRGTGRTELVVRNDSSRDISIIATLDSVATMIEKDSVFKENIEFTNDTRPVQGIEWIWIMVGLGAVVMILSIVNYYRKR